MTSEQIVELVVAERERQTLKWGKQDMPLFDWILVLQEELGEVAKAILENEPKKDLLNEAVQVAAVAVQMCEWNSENCGWPNNSREVLEILSLSRNLTPGSPAEAHLKINIEIGMLSECAIGNPFHNERLAIRMQRIAFYGCLLVYRLNLYHQ